MPTTFGQSLVIEAHGNLIYEYDHETAQMLNKDDLDEDEAEEIKDELAMNKKRL